MLVSCIFIVSSGGRGIRTPMSLAARWISSPLPYQLGLALQIAAFNASMHCWPLHSRVQPGKPLNIGSFPCFSGVILTALRASVNTSFIAPRPSFASSPRWRNRSAANQNPCIRVAPPMQPFIVSIPRAIAQASNFVSVENTRFSAPGGCGRHGSCRIHRKAMFKR
jgi:hypothetical protein